MSLSWNLCVSIGIEEKISYIQSLGANAFWITSFYESGEPLDGNDIVDHTKVNGILGTMDEFKAIRKDTKKKGIYEELIYGPALKDQEHIVLPLFVCLSAQT